MNIPRPEYPRPQFERSEWMNLNGEWQYEDDPGESGDARGLVNRRELSGRITVPFCCESSLSGIGNTDFCECMWYKKIFDIDKSWLLPGKTVILNIGACDWRADIWVNGTYIGNHCGGYVSFSFDITAAVREQNNILTVKVTDKLRSGNQPGGKQSHDYASGGCMYRRTTGIWQTVWLECMPKSHITNTRYFTDIDKCTLTIEAHTVDCEGITVNADAYYNGVPVGHGDAISFGGKCVIEVALCEKHLWEVGEGRLYDLELRAGDDTVKSYFGMREISCRDGIMYLNKKPVFQRLVLDQGFYPDGIYTAPTIDALYADVDKSMAMGFNGARLHQKVFEPLFLSYCDRRGYMVWGEHANWGMNASRNTVYEAFLPEWSEILLRDFNHPAIIGWCPINESDYNQSKPFMKLLSEFTRSYDTTRLYIDASGWTHEDGLSDIYDLHDYEQNPEEFAKHLAPCAEGKKINVQYIFGKGREYFCLPTFVSEYGGTRWAEKTEPGWGYGNAPESGKEFLIRFRGLTEVIMKHPRMGALCYTQLTDVEQEMNGLYTFDRKPKFDPAFFREVLSQPAATEKAESGDDQ